MAERVPVWLVSCIIKRDGVVNIVMRTREMRMRMITREMRRIRPVTVVLQLQPQTLTTLERRTLKCPWQSTRMMASWYKAME